jgi:hypothetical protein
MGKNSLFLSYMKTYCSVLDHYYARVRSGTDDRHVVWYQGQTSCPPERANSCENRIGRQAATDFEKQPPLVSERSPADNYIESVGRRLVRAIPSRYRPAPARD